MSSKGLIDDESCPREGEGVVCRGAVLAPEDNVYHGIWGDEPKIRAGKSRPYIYNSHIVKFDPKIHDRRPIRLQGYGYSHAGGYYVTIVAWHREFLFGKIVNNEMELSPYGEIVQKWWGEIPIHFPNVETGAFVIMPNHVHGIIFIVERRGTETVPRDDQPLNKLEPPNSNETWEQGGGPTLGQVVAISNISPQKK